MQIKTYRLIRRDGCPALEQTNGMDYQGKCDRPDDVYQLMCDVFGLGNSMDEFVYMICLDRLLNPLGVFELAHGGYGGSYVDFKSLFTRALLNGANSLVLVHNHPGGSVRPSEKDLDLTMCILQGCRILGLELQDHLIVASENYYSFKESGLLEDLSSTLVRLPIGKLM